jgi:hypothetical protein
MTTTKALECWYFADGDQALIRVVTQSPISGSLVGTESQGRAPYPQRTSLTLSWPRPKAQEWTSASRTRS